MGYGITAYVRALWELATPLGKKTMSKKADNVRKALIDGASPHRLAHVAVMRAQREYPGKIAGCHDVRWIPAAIAQLAAILKCDHATAHMWVSEHCDVRTTKS